MANSTLTKFGYPGTAITETEHWALLVRPAQVTLGSLVLCSKSQATAYGDLPHAAFTEQGELVRVAERLLTQFVGFQRINYLMLMMVDPHVHFHVIPRYEGGRTFAGIEFADSGWPGLPDLKTVQYAPPALVEELRRLAAAQFGGEPEHGGRGRDSTYDPTRVKGVLYH